MGGKIDMREFRKFVKDMEKLSETGLHDFCIQMAKELAAELYKKVIDRTPVQTGHLKRCWDVSPIRSEGDNWIVEVSNNVLYARYVEYGHRQKPAIRKRLVRAWSPGKFMLTISTNEVREGAVPKIERELENYLRGVMG